MTQNKKNRQPHISSYNKITIRARPELVEGFERSILRQAQDERVEEPNLRLFLSNHYKHVSLIILLALLCIPAYADLSSLAKNDPYPIFSTLNLDDLYLLTSQQLKFKDADAAKRKKSRANFSVSPFTQNADRGKTITDTPCPPVFVIDPSEAGCGELNTALGDLTGPSNMLALLYGHFPEGQITYPGGMNGYLMEAFFELFDGTSEMPGQLTNAKYLVPLGKTGCFSFPLKYRKRGVRFELDVRFWDDLGFRIQAGVSAIRQTVESRINLNTTDSPTDFEETINSSLMAEVDNIAQEMGLYIGDTNQASAEEVRLNLFWRHAFEFNQDAEYDWAHLLCIPYLEVAGSFTPGKTRNPNQLFAVPFGNDHHPSAGFTAGINFDFIETIEIGGEVSFTHFFKKNINNYRVPNSQYQTTIFPFTTNVSVQPGNNLLFGARLAAYHFVGNLSMYFEWFVLDHKRDKIELKIPDPAFLPGVLEQRSSFKTKFANFALNYDVSPNIGLGFLWQIPFSQRNAYRSATLMVGINITF